MQPFVDLPPTRRRHRSGDTPVAAALPGGEILPLLGAALWTARSQPLELVALDAGATARPAFGLDRAQLQPGAAWLESVYPPDRTRVAAFCHGRGARRPIEYRLIAGDGGLLWVRHWLVARSGARAGRRQLRGLLLAIPEQKHLEGECLRMSERECARVGQELHDDLGQVLTGLTCMTEVLGRRAARLAPAFARDARDLGRELRGVTDRVRALAHGLFPAQLDHLTLREGLDEFARQTRLRLPVACMVAFPGRPAPHSPHQILHLYRVVQEAVGNAIRHGGATAVRIRVTARDGRGQLCIQDNGTGFPARAVRPEGIGLHVMEYRARILGGALRCRNRARRGASVELDYPLDAHLPPVAGRTVFPP